MNKKIVRCIWKKIRLAFVGFYSDERQDKKRMSLVWFLIFIPVAHSFVSACEVIIKRVDAVEN